MAKFILCVAHCVCVCAHRAVLACSDDGPGDILHRICCLDHPQYLAGGLCLQEYQSQSKTQVRNYQHRLYVICV